MSFVLIDKPRPGVTQITFNRPERMNAMAFDVMVPLKEALEEISFDNETRVVILTGAGAGFCSGADLEDPGYLAIFDGLTMPGIARRAMKVLDDVILGEVYLVVFVKEILMANVGIPLDFTDGHVRDIL